MKKWWTKISLAPVIISLALSFFLWLVVSGQDLSAVDLAVPLELKGLPDTMMVSSELPANVTIQFLANAAQIKFLEDRKLRLVVDAGRARVGRNSLAISADDMDLPRGVQIRRIYPDRLEFTTIQLASKEVPVKVDVASEPPDNFLLDSIAVSPEVVTVTGPAFQLARIDSLSTTPLDLSDQRKDAEFTLALSRIGLGPEVVAEPQEFKVQVRLSVKMVERTFKGLPIQVSGPASSSVTLYPGKVDVVLAWPADLGLNVRPGDVAAHVRVQPEELGSEGRATAPILVDPPSGATVKSINPVETEIRVKPQ